MANLSYFTHAVMLKWMRGIPTTPPSQLFVGVMTSLPNPDGTNVTEPGGSYARQPITFTEQVSTGGYTAFQNTADIIFPLISQDWPQVAWIGVFDQDGHLLFYGTLAQPRAMKAGDYFGIGQGTVVLRLR